MRFDTTNAPIEEPQSSFIGNVYRCKGGNKTKYWVIVADAPGVGVVCLGIDGDGNITSSANYGRHVFEGYPWSRFPIGKVIEMPNMNFAVSWNGAEYRG